MGLFLSEHVERGGLALVEGDVPVLDAHALSAVEGGLVFADVARREDPRHRALQKRRAAHAAAVSDVESRLIGERDLRCHSCTDDDAFGVYLQTSARDHTLHAAVALEALELVAAVDDDAVLFQALVEEAARVAAEGAFERDLLEHDDRAAT